MKEVLSEAVRIYESYNGNSMYTVFFLCSLLFLFLREEEKGKRIILIYASACILGLFFLPPFAYVMIRIVFDHEVYYRFLWMLPIYLVIAYAAVRLIIEQRSRILRFFLCFFLIYMISFSQGYAYRIPTDRPAIEKATNFYKLPQSVIDICDQIIPEEEDAWVMALFPDELLSYPRQYSDQIRMPYGRDYIIPRWGYYHVLHEAVLETPVNTDYFVGHARAYECEYVILQEDKILDEPLIDYGYEEVGRVEGYIIYRDSKGVV